MNRLLPTLIVLAMASPTLAHEGHGAPGLLHGFSNEHGLALLAAVVVMGLTAWLHRPLARLGARLGEPLVRLLARRRNRP
jgi:hypothetical protein